jgi:acyl-CoA synthetase (AMP-forming)/AMP-acid ligase II
MSHQPARRTAAPQTIKLMHNPQTVPSLYASILYQSRVGPNAIAVIADRTTYTYREFCSQTEAVTRRLHACGIPAGKRVAIQASNEYFSRILILCAARMGLLSASVPPAEMDGLAPELILTDEPAKWPHHRVQAVDPKWLRSPADDLPPFVDREFPADMPARLSLSSGTTGKSKFVVHTYGQLHRRNKQQIGDYGFTGNSRLLTVIGVAGIAGMILPINCWSAGGSVILPGPQTGTALARLLRQQPNIVMLSPAQLEGILSMLPPDFVPLHEMRVYAAGSALSRNLNVRARLRLTQSLFLCYGSTEIGTIALAPAGHAQFRPGLTGYVVPPVVLEIVDEKGEKVPNGTTGEVRVRAEGQAEAYLDDAEATAQNFRDGWFYPGDLGVLGDHGDLRIVGRLKELMNIGGFKIAPELMEEPLRDLPGVSDLAVFPVIRTEGERPGVAIVCAHPIPIEELRRRHAEAFPRLPALVVFSVDKIPRNEMGKVMRVELAKQVASMEAVTSAQGNAGLH